MCQQTKERGREGGREERGGGKAKGDSVCVCVCVCFGGGGVLPALGSHLLLQGKSLNQVEELSSFPYHPCPLDRRELVCRREVVMAVELVNSHTQG